jgi:hypothetical protein
MNHNVAGIVAIGSVILWLLATAAYQYRPLARRFAAYDFFRILPT